MNAIIFLVVTVLFPVADIIWQARCNQKFGQMGHFIDIVIHSSDFSHLAAVSIIAALVTVCFLFVWAKAMKWAFPKLNKLFGEEVVGTFIWFCLTLWPIAVNAIKHF